MTGGPVKDDGGGVNVGSIACQSGCDLEGSTKYAWPRYRHDAGTGAALERVHEALLGALAAAPA